MLRRLGYVAIALSIDSSTNRTCRLRNATPERLRTLIDSNLSGLHDILAFNQENGISLYRISSQIIPFASHSVNQLEWWEEFADRLDGIGSLIREHDMRVSMHPGQFTVLNSTRPETVEAAIEDLRWHARLLDSLGLDTRHKIVVHIGGATGGKAAAMDRFGRRAADLPDPIRRRLVIENDERIYTARDALALAGRTGLPVVFDWLHHNANHEEGEATSASMADCFRTWQDADGPPKMHLSSQNRDGPPGKHADWIALEDAVEMLAVAPATPFDCMLEAKQKDRALFRLRDELAGQGIIEAGSGGDVASLREGSPEPE